MGALRPRTPNKSAINAQAYALKRARLNAQHGQHGSQANKPVPSLAGLQTQPELKSQVSFVCVTRSLPADFSPEQLYAVKRYLWLYIWLVPKIHICAQHVASDTSIFKSTCMLHCVAEQTTKTVLTTALTCIAVPLGQVSLKLQFWLSSLHVSLQKSGYKDPQLCTYRQQCCLYICCCLTCRPCNRG